MQRANLVMIVKTGGKSEIFIVTLQESISRIKEQFPVISSYKIDSNMVYDHEHKSISLWELIKKNEGQKQENMNKHEFMFQRDLKPSHIWPLRSRLKNKWTLTRIHQIALRAILSIRITSQFEHFWCAIGYHILLSKPNILTWQMPHFVILVFGFHGTNHSL